MQSTASGVVQATLIGVLSYFIVVGPAPLDVTNIAWIQGHDPPMFYLGWVSYRHSSWMWPITLNPDFGLDHASSILFTDSIPLFAMVFKLLDPLLPEPFQYFGLWFLLCFALQGVFAWLIVRLFVSDRIIQLLLVAFFTLAPPMIFRTLSPEASHFTLVSHWQVLMAFWLCLRDSERGRIAGWTILIAVGVLTHPYILAITLPLWLADMFRWRILLWKGLPYRLIVELACVAIAILVFGGLSGLYSTPPAAQGAPVAEFAKTWELGSYGTNLLTPIDPSGWSLVLHDFATRPTGAYEGFAFPGLGGLAIIAWALALAPAAWRSEPINWSYWPLAAAVLAMAAFSVGPEVWIGTYLLHTFNWPWALDTIGQVFRATGRFIWPGFYAGMLLACWVLARRVPKRILAPALAILIVVQAVDTRAGWGFIKHGYDQVGSTWDVSLNSPFWPVAMARYGKVRHAPPTLDPPMDRWQDVAYLAIGHGLGIDAVHIARESPAVMSELNARVEAAIASGDWPEDTIYILEKPLAVRAMQTANRNRDALALVDGFIVLAPGWNACAECPRLEPFEG